MRRFAETLGRFLGHGRREVGRRDGAGRADGGEGRLGGEPSARSYVEDAHTRCKMGGAQQEGHEVRRDVRESTAVLCRRLVPEGQFAGHSLPRSIPPITHYTLKRPPGGSTGRAAEIRAEWAYARQSAQHRYGTFR